MKFKILTTFLVAVFILILTPIPYVLSQTQGSYEPQELTFEIYSDGFVFIDYTVKVDPTLSTVNVKCFGVNYEDFTVLDEDETPLEYTQLDGSITVYSLGSSMLHISYLTGDLTGKSERIWIFNVETPIVSKIILPAQAVIVSLSSVPVNIKTLDDGRKMLTMPKGSTEISYIIEVAGTKDYALLCITNAENAVKKAENEGRVIGLDEAKQLLDEAKNKFRTGSYLEAGKLAEKAKEVADKASAPIQLTTILTYLAISVILIILAGILAYKFLLKKGESKTGYVKKAFTINLDKIFRQHSQLRLEDKEVLEFIANSGGEVFEAEIREKFKLPKTTVWRTIQRLKKEGIIDVLKIGGQNLVRIKQKYQA
ncbi:MAG: DUF7343 domain-containing protein [Candidatus Bathyarchaeota archaeon]